MAMFTLELDRTLTVDMAPVRIEVLRVLRDLDFHVTTSQITLLEARRGSKMTGGLLGAKKLPLLVRVILSTEENGTRLRILMADDLLAPIGAGFGTTYETSMRQVQEGIDLALSRLDPASAKNFSLPRFTGHGSSNDRLEKLTGAVSEKGEIIGDTVSGWLGGSKGDDTPTAWRGIQSIRFNGPTGSAVMDPDTVQGLLAVAAMVMSQPASLPANLRQALEQFAAKVEHGMSVQRWGEVLIPVSAEEKPVFEFMRQQAMIREHLPVRTVHRCRTCAFERITNPDYEQLKKRNETIQKAMGMVGASVSGRGISPFVLVGSIFKFKKLDPEYVCPRCQGLDAEERIVTFCPQCGDMRDEAALRICPKCKYDFRTLLTPEAIWQELPSPPKASLPLPAEAPLSSPQEASLPPPTTEIGESADQVRMVTTPGVCPQCSAPIHRGVLLCWSCKTRLSWDSPPSAAATVVAPSPPAPAVTTTGAAPRQCPTCAAERQQGAMFCGHCGTRFGDDDAQGQARSESTLESPGRVVGQAMPGGALLVATPGVCPGCAASIHRGVKFCWKCKAALCW
ncbi:MAG: zinc ribbon domain-containing protein [Chloroflexota bacterium]|nr:zinc ribbon domain-containing protein [Chloroflexota bacterium]